MGRKIPGRKHHGVRDPEKQRIERLKKIKDKINAPPTNLDDQQIPKTLQRIMELKNKAKSGAFTRKKPKKSRPREMFEQWPDESDRDFLQRVNRHCAVVKHEAAFENKFGVEIKRNAEGEIEEIKKRPKDPIQLMIKEARKQKKKKKAKGDEEKLTKSQKRRLKLVDKKKKRLAENVDDFSKFKDNVKFGEQAHAPPTLTAPKKAKNKDEAPRPGKKDLLLKSMLHKTTNKVIDKKAKRKDLPHALRRQLDQQQKEVMEAYKLLKEKKRGVIK